MDKKEGNYSEEEAWKIRAKTYRSMLHAEIDEKVELNVIATLAQRRIDDLEEQIENATKSTRPESEPEPRPESGPATE